ncbi:sphingomyelin phosphodiesterase-like protein 2 [Leptotrombidium deliense]|uniref:Sphingomyelin phosphodiesterase n=1 Tax=Leptotrombidium deliense TaxID=299467 RepID=A0A443SJZ0_9ACAR|nr:sphingomyelin phosphodiesterase-like protein 2 [Leptotrombidium deliense]
MFGRSFRAQDTEENFVIKTLSKAIVTIGRNELITAIKNGFKEHSLCVGCHILMLILKSSLPRKVLVNAFIFVCTSFQFAKTYECQGLLNTYAVCIPLRKQFENFKSLQPTINHIRKKSRLRGDEMCGVFFGVKCALKVTRNLHWTIHLPKAIESKNNREISLNPNGYFIQVTDIHPDANYSPGSCADCGGMLCCEKLSGQCTGDSAAGNWSDYRKCDMSLEVIDYVLSRLKVHKDAKFMLITGDYVKHNTWEVSIEQSKFYINWITNSILKSNYPFRIFPSVGNHEAAPVNCFAPPQVKNELNTTWLYEGGYYKEYIDENTVLIQVNSNYCNRLNFWLLMYPIDSGDQLKWLTSELYETEKAGKKAYIVMHIPVDNRECTEAWTWNYIRIIKRFQKIIVGQFFGHRHYAEFRVMYPLDGSNTVIGVQFITPSLTTFSATNTAYRLYFTDQQGFVTDFETHYLPLEEANKGNVYWKKITPQNGLSFQLQKFQDFDIFREGMQLSNMREYCLFYTSNAINSLHNCSDDNYLRKIVDDAPVCIPFKCPLKGLEV